MARRLNLLASAVNFLTSPFKAKAAPSGLVSAGGSSFGLQYGFAGLAYQPHEPFTQAWQKGHQEAGHRDPMLLAFSGVYACVTIISQDVAKLPVRVVQLGDDGITETVARNNPYHRLLKKPNDYQTSVDFFQNMLSSRLLRGNAYVYKEMDGRGVPFALHVLHPDRVKVMIHPQSKEIFYAYTPYYNDLIALEQYFMDERGQFYIPARFIIHDRINALWHPLIGTSPLFAAAMSASMGGRIVMNSQALFANMARPSGILTAPGEISDVVAQRLKRDFEANYSAGNLGKTAVLGDGLEWKQMVITSTDAQLIEQLKWTIEDVARAYRIPMYLLATTQGMTYRNSEQLAQSYYAGCLQYHIESMERRLTCDFGMDDETQYVAVEVRQMFRMDTVERFAAYKEGIAAGILSPNEARKWEGLGPVKGGEQPRMQMQYVPLDTPVADPTATVPPAPKPPAPSPADGPAPAPADGPAPAPAPGDADGGSKAAQQAEEERARLARQEMLGIMKRVSAGAARAKFAYEGLDQ